MVKSTVTKLERGIVELFFKTVGAELGLFDFQERVFRAGVEREGVYQENLTQVRAALKDMTAADLETFIRDRYRAGDRAALLSEIWSKTAAPGKATLETDLLAGLDRPMHPALFDRTMPSFVVGETSMLSMGGASNTVKPVFTLRQLIQQYFAAVHVAALLSRQQLGPWNWLLQQADLNEILFAIDFAGEVSTREAREITPFGLVDYLPQARAALGVMYARQHEGNP